MVKKNQDQITAHKIYFVFHQINYSQGSCAYQKRLDSMQFTALKFNKKLSSFNGYLGFKEKTFSS